MGSYETILRRGACALAVGCFMWGQAGTATAAEVSADQIVNALAPAPATRGLTAPEAKPMSASEQAFVKSLTGIYHSRIEYPAGPTDLAPENDEKKTGDLLPEETVAKPPVNGSPASEGPPGSRSPHAGTAHLGVAESRGHLDV